MKEFTEEQIWKEFRSGNEEALVYIYEKYINVLYNYGRQFTAKEELVKDAIQDLFCELIRNRQNLGNTDSIKYYLMASLRNKLVRTLKYKENYTLLDDREQSFMLTLADESFGQEELNLQNSIEIAFQKLPPRQREALVLHYYENLSYNQISKCMQIGKVKSARALVYRALDSLAGLLWSSSRSV